MIEQLISFETAKLAKEKGVSIYGYLQDVWLGNKYKGKKEIMVFGLGNSSVLPTQSLLQKWLREVHNIDIDLQKHSSGYIAVLRVHYTISGNKIIKTSLFNTYEEALEKGLVEGLKLIKI